MLATVFGLDVRAERSLSFLESAPANPTGRRLDLSLDPDAAPAWPETAELISDQRLPDGEINFQIERSRGGDYRIWGPPYGGTVLSGDGQRLWAEDGADSATWQRLLVAQALPFAAVLRGLEVLHASAVVVEGGAIALAGPSGSGKTSLALELCRRGGRLLTDDVLALEIGAGLVVHPGSPVVGVDRAEARRLREIGVAAGETFSWDERETVERVSLHPQPLPLRAVFLLERGEGFPPAPSFEPLDEPSALLASTFNLVLRDPQRLARLLEVCAQIAKGRVERIRVAPTAGVSELGGAVLERIGGGS